MPWKTVLSQEAFFLEEKKSARIGFFIDSSGSLTSEFFLHVNLDSSFGFDVKLQNHLPNTGAPDISIRYEGKVADLSFLKNTFATTFVSLKEAVTTGEIRFPGSKENQNQERALVLEYLEELRLAGKFI